MLYVLKVVTLFTLSIAALRLMGKSTLAQVTPHDLMAIVVIAALATHPILVNDYWKTIGAIALVAGMHFLYAKLTLYRWSKRFILGEPTILVKHGKIIQKNLRRCELSLTELLGNIRSEGYPDLREVQYAILEPTGSLSVLPRDDLYPATPKDLNIPVPYRGLALSLVVDGKIQKQNLKLIGKDRDWLKRELKKQGFEEIRQVMYAATRECEPEIYVDTGSGDSK
ncbi:uncharacterized membrane protein YcaP (DUF421 family) [Melghirimyces profundicolus]|uniref:Uncharacterized membrane protein YcaP (DUF421 family) n=1 Tax=Melghirimyces profundicolus TaxID=1242148 RepID=A0A2T6C7J8_9BACL|nr:DUF421 domain-containing protein [Melghirimyces profundicolus]PTX64263.1 uncharacterized membrane protein YcaP (DUF421 family) [Melghirimyces profundicolus]